MKKLLLLLLLAALWPGTAALVQVKVQHLRCENLANPLGLDVARPRFSWQLLVGKGQRGIKQTACELRVATSPGVQKDFVWQSGQVAADSSINVTHAGPALAAAQRYYWQVRVWDNAGKASAWSAPAMWQTGLLKPTNWTAAWIGPGYAEDSVQRPCPRLRKEFTISKKLVSATAFVTAHARGV